MLTDELGFSALCYLPVVLLLGAALVLLAGRLFLSLLLYAGGAGVILSHFEVGTIQQVGLAGLGYALLVFSAGMVVLSAVLQTSRGIRPLAAAVLVGTAIVWGWNGYQMVCSVMLG